MKRPSNTEVLNLFNNIQCSNGYLRVKREQDMRIEWEYCGHIVKTEINEIYVSFYCELDEYFKCSKLYFFADCDSVEDMKADYLNHMDWWINAKGN